MKEVIIIFCKLINRKRILPDPFIKIKKELTRRQKINAKKEELSLEDKNLVQQIQEQTNSLNKNNVTRTQAYLDFYNRHREIHWAFLGHMVSRNGGWNMTDLKGGLLSRLLTQTEARSFFTFLERGNWLIFQDAYPQFLIYEESKKRGKNLMYLLHQFHISLFMETIWNYFWEYSDSNVLTIALIINEQSYLESRVVDNPAFKQEVFNTLEFKIQDFLSMNHILFPYSEDGKVKLVGQTLHHFESLRERILIGKRLYTIMFEDYKRLKLIEEWAVTHPHTGSRKDYWKHIFNDVDEGLPGKLYKARLKSCQLLQGSSRFYSPQLESAWKNKQHHSAEKTDWYDNWKVLYYFIDTSEKIDGEIEGDYCQTLERLELAAIAKKAISLLD